MTIYQYKTIHILEFYVIQRLIQYRVHPIGKSKAPVIYLPSQPHSLSISTDIS